VIVKDPPVDPAVKEAPVKVTMPFDGTVTQLLVGALKVEPDGPEPVNVTK
jgi:methionine-rich copper-binding protein CopC